MSQSFDNYCSGCKWDPCICEDAMRCKDCGNSVPGYSWHYHLGSYWNEATCPTKVAARRRDFEKRMAKWGKR